MGALGNRAPTIVVSAEGPRRHPKARRDLGVVRMYIGQRWTDLLYECWYMIAIYRQRPFPTETSPGYEISANGFHALKLRRSARVQGGRPLNFPRHTGDGTRHTSHGTLPHCHAAHGTRHTAHRTLCAWHTVHATGHMAHRTWYTGQISRTNNLLDRARHTISTGWDGS